ncbi:hypothetical protein ACLQ3C_06495 [Gordonia sp. DT30]|uniref:hypothetical protein n=1 Tax=unclassified Gordonia (in: high G+C Gram-positive bacteria) TaxID=2657482 RepID=UPI003CE96B35
MTERGGELARVLDGAPSTPRSAMRGDGLPASVRAELASSATRYARGLTVAVSGRAGTGRDTMTRALRQRLRVGALGPGEDGTAVAAADLWVHMIVAAPRRADHVMLAALPADRTIVVLGKADTFADPHIALEASAAAAHELARPVVAVSALLACADITEVEWTFLADLAAAGEHMPSMSGQFLVGAPGSRERALRLGLLRRLDRYGVDTALELLGDRAVPDAAALNAVMHRLSGIDALVPAFSDRVGIVRGRREALVRERLDLLAAAGPGRAGIEQLLRVGEVTW